MSNLALLFRSVWCCFGNLNEYDDGGGLKRRSNVKSCGSTASDNSSSSDGSIECRRLPTETRPSNICASSQYFPNFGTKQLIDNLKKGRPMIKLSRKGRFHHRTIVISSDESSLMWSGPGSPSGKVYSFFTLRGVYTEKNGTIKKGSCVQKMNEDIKRRTIQLDFSIRLLEIVCSTSEEAHALETVFITLSKDPSRLTASC